MKKKYFVITFLLIILGYAVYGLLKVEESIRKQRTVTVTVIEKKERYLSDIRLEDLTKLSEASEYNFRVEADYFQVNETVIEKGLKKQEWNPIFIKGINLGVALPGKFPSEFPLSYDLYLDWLIKIGEMNTNVVRIYTIFPPEFYDAFAQYNLLHSDKPLYLMHGVWARVPEKQNNYLSENYTDEFQQEIKNAINVIHGNAVLPEVRGHASGIYVSDISDYTIAFLLGREWEPQSVALTNSENDVNNYAGNFISIPIGSPMEVWLAKMMDFTAQYETQHYSAQRPLSFVNWPTLDPMFHNTEIIENENVREYDNDLETIDFRKFYHSELFKPGLYAAYHVYPYYPDFISLDEKFNNSLNKDGLKDNYYGYLKDLKKYCPDMPLIIAEYGTPSSRGNSHYSPLGFHQGGHSEAEQARINKILTEDIYNTHCGGAVIFEWIDEWFKFNWLVMDFEQPAERRKYWHNMENPEQNFGIMAVESKTKIIDGIDNDWTEEDYQIYSNNFTISSSADPEYFYLKYELPSFNFDKNNLHIAIDTYDKVKGDHTLPLLNIESKNGIEFLLQFQNQEDAVILVDDKYTVFTDKINKIVPIYASKENNDGKFIEQILLSNRRRETILGEKFPQKFHNRSKLKHGNSSESVNSNADWFWNNDSKILEIRLDWHLLNISDPSSLQVLDDKKDTKNIETTTVDNFNIFTYITNKENIIETYLPGENEPFSYIWDKWDIPEFKFRVKPTYNALKILFSELNPVKINNEENNSIEEFRFTKWYMDKQGAISISFDDASYGQYEYAIPTLDKYELKASFGVVGEWTYNNPTVSADGDNFGIKKMGWTQIRELHENGHEISAHGYEHKPYNPDQPDIDLINQMVKIKDLIEKNIKAPISTLHYPYSFTRHNIIKSAKDVGFVFGRTSEERINEVHNSNMNLLFSKTILNSDDPSMHDLENWLKNAEENWLIILYHHIFPEDSKEMKLFNFHNVYNRFSTTPEMFEKQIRLLRNSDYWIAPISSVGKYIVERENSKIISHNYGNKIILSFENNLDSKFYDQPLSVEFTTNWKIIKISGSTSDGIHNTRNNKIIFNVQPNTEIILERMEK